MGDDEVKVVYVKASEVAAAKLLIKCNEMLGRETDPRIVRIANARRARRHD